MEWLSAIGDALEKVHTYVLPHAPFLGATLILLIVGQWLSGVFTKSRAYRFYGNTRAGKWKWRCFYWGRELLPAFPILLGVLIGLLWKDPEERGWRRAASVGYFASAGAVSMMLWAIIKGWSKKKGIALTLPGESEPPEGDRTPYDEVPIELVESIPPQVSAIAAAIERRAPRLDAASSTQSDEEIDARDTLRPKPRALVPPPRIVPKRRDLE